MNDIRFKNLWDAFTSDLDYCNFLESFGNDDVDFKNTNFDLLKVIYGGFALTLFMDDYFVKKNDQIKSELHPSVVVQLVKKIAIKNPKGYTIGNLHYANECDLLVKLRNKLAHGDFIVRDGNIVIVENNQEGIININRFIGFLSDFESCCMSTTLNKPYTKVYNISFEEHMTRTIKTEQGVDIACNNIYKIELTDEPIPPITRTPEYMGILEYFYKEVERRANNKDIKGIETLFQKNKEILKKHNIKMDCKITKVKQLEYYDEIKKRYLQKKELNKNVPLAQQVNFINNFSFNIGKGRKMNIIKGIMLNLVVLDKLKNNPKASLADIINSTPTIRSMYHYHLDDAILSSYLVGFNSMYQYGLEKGLTVQGSYNLVKIFNGESLDFSKLLVDELDDPNMEIEHTFTKYKTDVDEYEKKELAAKDARINVCINKLNNYINNCKNQEQSKIDGFKKEINELKELKQQLIEEIKKLKEFSNNFDLNKYTKNFNIIVHIRNAIAHGNVFIEEFSDNALGYVVKFVDYKDGKVVYDKSVKISDFVKLFGSINVNCILDYITNNIENKNLIDKNYQLELCVRAFLRKLDSDYPFKTKTR